ncbi:DUF559 domain-containing protein [Mycobacteroides salmoniphilum]|nr:DUF559 domain-containing protein [Mycobacteroides salmoniphilum]
MAEIEFPFLGAEALTGGLLTHHQLRRDFQAVYRNVYVPRGIELKATQRAEAAWLWSRRHAIVAGLSAAALHGSQWIDATSPAELNRGPRDPVAGIRIHTEQLDPAEVVEVDGIPVTSAARTAFDLGRRPGPSVALQRLDALAQATLFPVDEVAHIVEKRKGMRGLVQLRKILPLVDGGSESPQETRTRYLLLRSGLPKPQTQIRVYTRYGEFVARIDMGWEDVKVGVEFDGAQHWTDPRQRTRDIDRSAQLADEGWRIIRVSSDMLRYRPGTIVARVYEALGQSRWAA